MTILAKDIIKRIKNFFEVKHCKDRWRTYKSKIKLYLNENPHGTSKNVRYAIIKKTLRGLNRYPEAEEDELNKLIAKKYEVEHENILLTNGTDEAIRFIAQTFLRYRDEVIIPIPTFSRYEEVSKIHGAKIIDVKLKNFSVDIQGILNSITDKTRIIWIANPNNPTGKLLNKEEVCYFLDRVPQNILVVYDGAYSEFSDDKNRINNICHIFKRYNNVLILKTFSKFYGMAALRIGYIIGDIRLISIINKNRGPYSINTLSLVGAINAIQDSKFIGKIYDENIKGKHFIYREFDKLDIFYLHTQANYILFRIKDKNAFDVYQDLCRKGILISIFENKYLRVSVGTKKENDKFIKIIKEITTKN